MKIHQLSDGDEIDQIVYDPYGDLPGAIEIVLRANWDVLSAFDDLGRFSFDQFAKGEKPILKLILPDISRPTEVKTTPRIFD